MIQGDTAQDEPAPQPQQQIRPTRRRPTPFGINDVMGQQSSDSDRSRISRQSRSSAVVRPVEERTRTCVVGKRVMQNVTEAVNDELVKSLDYKLGSSNVNYIQSRKDAQYFPSSLSTFTPTTSRVARIPLTSGMDFIDPESVKIAFRVRNNSTTLGLNPGTQEPSCFIKRVQLFANGQRCDDISEYRRCCFLYSLLKPAERYRNKGITGFWEVAGAPAPIPAESFKDVLMAPTLIGMFQAGKFLPPQLNLVLELEFAEATDALRPGGLYPSKNARVLASQVTLDLALYESYQKILLSGRSLVFAYPRRLWRACDGLDGLHAPRNHHSDSKHCAALARRPPSCARFDSLRTSLCCRGVHRRQRFRSHGHQHQLDPGPGLESQPVRSRRFAGRSKRQEHAGFGGSHNWRTTRPRRP